MRTASVSTEPGPPVTGTWKCRSPPSWERGLARSSCFIPVTSWQPIYLATHGPAGPPGGLPSEPIGGSCPLAGRMFRGLLGLPAVGEAHRWGEAACFPHVCVDTLFPSQVCSVRPGESPFGQGGLCWSPVAGRSGPCPTSWVSSGDMGSLSLPRPQIRCWEVGQ